jgi:hypothetical protein
MINAIKQIGFQKIKIIFASAKDAKNAQDSEGVFSDEILEAIQNFKSPDTKFGDIEFSGNIREDFDSYRVGKTIYIW